MAQPAEPTAADEENAIEAEAVGELATENSSDSPIEESRDLEIYYLPDENGNLVPVLRGMRFEDFEAIYREQQGLERPRPEADYSLEESDITLSVAGNLATAVVRYRIRCTDSGWTRVPVGLPEMLLTEEPTYEGEGEFFLRYEQESGGYVAWLRGVKGEEHTLTLPLQTGIEQRAAERSLRFSVPRATLSRMSATIDSPQASLISPHRERFSQTQAPDGNSTRWVALGLEGEVVLSWRDAGLPEAQSTGVLDVEMNLLVGVETQSNRRYSLNYTAHLVVRSYGEMVERFTVALPAGATLTTGEATLYQAEEIPGSAPNGGSLVTVTLPQPSAGPIRVVLQATQEVADPAPEQWLPVGGFQVQEAARQSGYVALAVEDDWQVRWRTGEGEATVRRIEDLPEELAAESIVAPFAFDSQPFLLEIRVFERETQKRVEPIYIVTIEDRELNLEARLQYEVRGGKARYLDIDMGNWDLRTVGPSDIVQEGPLRTETQPVIVPLLQAMSGRFELRLTARQTLPARNDELSFDFTLPRPNVNSEGAATVVILAGDQLSLTPDYEEMTGWSADVLPAWFEPDSEYGEPLVFRLDNPQSAGSFSAVVERRARETSVELSGRAHVGEQAVNLEQTLRYSVRYAPLNQLPLRVPAEFRNADSIEWFLNGERLAARIETAVDDQETEGQDCVLRLPAPQMGSFELTARCVLPRNAESESKGAVRVPLITPRDATQIANEFVIASPNSVGVQLNDGRWQLGLTRAESGEILLRSNSSPSSIALIATSLQAAPEVVRIDRMWHQTWLADSKRRERVGFHLESQANELRIELPETAGSDQVPWIFVDNFSVQPAGDSTGGWVIALPNTNDSTEHVVEIMYESVRQNGAGALSIAPPRIEGSSGPYRMYWELVSQPGEILISAPEGMTDEADWGWGFLSAPLVGELPYPTRSPGWSQEELERWVGSTEQAPPPAGANRYLLSTFDEPSELRIRTVNRAQMVLLASAFVLGGGLLLMYFPRLCTLKMLFVVGVVVAAIGIWNAPLALQLARLAALGVGILILARVMLLLLTWQQRPAVLGSTGSDSESRRNYFPPLIEEAGSGQTTATAPAAISTPPLSAAESSR